MVVAIGLFVGAAVIGLTLYTATIERTREYGILKAVGVSNAYLYKIVIQQAFVVSMLGFAVGGILLGVASFLIESVFVEFGILMTIPLLLEVFLLVCFTGLVASYLPIRSMAKIDPAIVFKT